MHHASILAWLCLNPPLGDAAIFEASGQLAHYLGKCRARDHFLDRQELQEYQGCTANAPKSDTVLFRCASGPI